MTGATSGASGGASTSSTAGKTRTFPGKTIKRTLPAHAHAVIKIPLTAKTRVAIRAALKTHRHAETVVTIKVTGARRVGHVTFVYSP